MRKKPAPRFPAKTAAVAAIAFGLLAVLGCMKPAPREDATALDISPPSASGASAPEAATAKAHAYGEISPWLGASRLVEREPISFSALSGQWVDYLSDERAGPDSGQLALERNLTGVDETRDLARDCAGLIFFPDPDKGQGRTPVRATLVSLEERELVPVERLRPFFATILAGGKEMTVPSYQVAFVMARYGELEVAILRDYDWEEEVQEIDREYRYLDICATDTLVLAKGGDGPRVWMERLGTSTQVTRWGTISLQDGVPLLAIEFSHYVWNFHYPTGIERNSEYDILHPCEAPRLIDFAVMEIVPSPFPCFIPWDGGPVFSSRLDHGFPDLVLDVIGSGWKQILRDNRDVVLELPWAYEAPGDLELRESPDENAPIAWTYSVEYDPLDYIVSVDVLPGEVDFGGTPGWWLKLRVQTSQGPFVGWIPSTSLVPIEPWQGFPF